MSSSCFARQFAARLLAIGLIQVLLAHKGAALDNGLALTPPMGWLSWVRFACEIDCQAYPEDCISARLYEQMADRLVADGFAKVGYQYVNIDDCWSELKRDPQLNTLAANSSRFPLGIIGLAVDLHSRGLKLGLYGDCGTTTCAGYPAQLKSEQNLEDNYFEVDARSFAGDWKIDSFKFDGCFLDPAKAESICPEFATALNATERPVLLVCEWPYYMLRQIYNYNNKELTPNFELAARSCNAWRYYEDIEDSWLSVLDIVDFTVRLQQTIVKYHGPGHWFDPDQLIIGNFGLSLDQARSQMALWCLWSAPLYMSNDLRALSPEMAAVLKNENLIAVDQDKLGVLGLMVKQTADGHHQAFAKPVEPVLHGCPSFAVVYLNRDTLGNGKELSFSVRDLLVELPISLAAQRYDALYPATGGAKQPGGKFDAEECLHLLRSGMTRDLKASKLLVKPLNSAADSPVEEQRIHFQAIDLFGDEPDRNVSLNESLTLRVNPSGVRAFKLVRM